MHDLARTLLGLTCILTSTIGCKDKPAPEQRTPVAQPTPAQPTPSPASAPERTAPKLEFAVAPGVVAKLGNAKGSRCRRTLCIAGPGALDGDGNRDLAELCRRSPGIVQRCDDKGPAERGRDRDGCTTLWAPDAWQDALAGLLASLDRNADGEVDERDPACPISLAGWSTGAVIVADALPKALAERARGPHAKVANLLATVPYQPGLARLELPSNIERAFVYRNSKAPADDCSRAFEGGPWSSPPLSCSPSTTCYDYDYSIDFGALAYISRRGSRAGNQVGHCNINSVVAMIGLDNIARGEESLRELVPPYVDGKQGGRVLPEGEHRPNPAMQPSREP